MLILIQDEGYLMIYIHDALWLFEAPCRAVGALFSPLPFKQPPLVKSEGSQDFLCQCFTHEYEVNLLKKAADFFLLHSDLFHSVVQAPLLALLLSP